MDDPTAGAQAVECLSQASVSDGEARAQLTPREWRFLSQERLDGAVIKRLCVVERLRDANDSNSAMSRTKPQYCNPSYTAKPPLANDPSP